MCLLDMPDAYKPKENMSWHLYTCVKNLVTALYGTETHEPQITQIGIVSSAYHQANLPA
jgi:hypothetical protein